jgi:hypothetical protein
LESAKLGYTEKMEGFRRLDQFARRVEEKYRPIADFAGALAHEHAISRSIGGRTVFDDRRKSRAPSVATQLDLFH